ncbi:MAG TPA: rubrerythrin family protein [Dehalococcoidia bacterium]|nr:rubrerythrin family protein [Dehalococcoidia bacterium]
MSKSTENLETAFAGESQANRKYLFFAEQADKEGHRQIARLFRAAAEAETVHARKHLTVLEGIRSTGDNLQAAVGGEHYEFTEMYPEFIRQAEAEGESKARTSFDLANQVEKVHHVLFKAALDMLEKKQAPEDKTFYVCQVCGYTVEGEAPDKCPICGAPKVKFKPVD